MKIYNTLSRKKEELKTIEEGKVRIYVCGPTVYNLIHIGNARPLIVFDTFRRYLEYVGYEVNFVQNFTDIDDKIIKKANEEECSIGEITKRYIDEYFTDAKGLGVRAATVHPKATENIEEIIEFISDLIEKGYAYESQGDVYFRTKKFGEYGKLSHMPLEELEAGARIDVSDIKEDPMDFALWKKAKEGEPYYSSPFSEGRPGWHIECSVMANKYLGETIDIHCGGKDLSFPHHENEIAQSECKNGCTFANYWMHNGFLNIDNKKMSKSKNNFFTVREIAEKYGYETIRFFMLQAHYRTPINFTQEIIEGSKASLERLYNCLDNMNYVIKNSSVSKNEEDDKIIESVLCYKEKFKEAMEDDLNTADAISAIFELTRDININLIEDKNPSLYLAEEFKKIFTELCGVLNIVEEKTEVLDEEIEKLIEERQQARKNKDFKRADEIRDYLKEKGIVLEDTCEGVKFKRV